MIYVVIPFADRDTKDVLARIRDIDKGAYDSPMLLEPTFSNSAAQLSRWLRRWDFPRIQTNSRASSCKSMTIMVLQIESFGSGYPLLGNVMTGDLKDGSGSSMQGSPGYANHACSVGVDLEANCEDRSSVCAHPHSVGWPFGLLTVP